MTTFHIGCAGFQRPREQYAARLKFVEIDLRPPVPPPKTLAGWRRALPEGFVAAVVAPPALYGERDWPLRDEAKITSELDRMANNARALGARIAVFRTPVAVSPGSVALKRFAPVLERAKRVADVVVWDPAGLWERDEALAVAAPHGVVVACDPLRDDVADEAVVYARLRGLGGEQRYHAGRLEDIAEKLDGVGEAYVVFDSADGWREAVRFAKLVGELAAEEGEGEDEGDEGDEDEDEGEGEGDEDDEDEG